MAETFYAYSEDELPGTLMAYIDESAPYEIDQTAILTEDNKWVLATASGCSCWGGEWELSRFADLESLFAAIGPTTEASGYTHQYNPSFAGVEALRAQVEAKLNA